MKKDPEFFHHNNIHFISKVFAANLKSKVFLLVESHFKGFKMMSDAGDAEVDTDDNFIIDIDVLQSQGINVADLKKLKSAGICTIRGLKMNTKRELCQIKGLSEAKVDKIKEAIIKLEGNHGASAFVTALQVDL